MIAPGRVVGLDYNVDRPTRAEGAHAQVCLGKPEAVFSDVEGLGDVVRDGNGSG